MTLRSWVCRRPLGERSILITPSPTSTCSMMPLIVEVAPALSGPTIVAVGSSRKGGRQSNLRPCNRRASPGARAALWRQRIAEGMGPKPRPGASRTHHPAPAAASPRAVLLARVLRPRRAFSSRSRENDPRSPCKRFGHKSAFDRPGSHPRRKVYF